MVSVDVTCLFPPWSPSPGLFLVFAFSMPRKSYWFYSLISGSNSWGSQRWNIWQILEPSGRHRALKIVKMGKNVKITK